VKIFLYIFLQRPDWILAGMPVSAGDTLGTRFVKIKQNLIFYINKVEDVFEWEINAEFCRRIMQMMAILSAVL
jgi:hypothetical protein